jgi:hypothetical protein
VQEEALIRIRRSETIGFGVSRRKSVKTIWRLSSAAAGVIRPAREARIFLGSLGLDA